MPRTFEVIPSGIMFEATIPPCLHADCRTRAHDPRWALLVAVLGSSMAFLDSNVVNVALPVMQRDLSLSLDGAQWIVEAYALLLSALVLVGGALGDRLGRRRVFLSGVSLFALASAACGVAPGQTALVLARAIQGAGAALLVPGSLAIISAAYDEQSRGKAIGTWSAFSAVTAAIGPVAGGWVVMHASWRWLFYFNVPVAIAVVIIALRRVAETRDDEAPSGIDWLGAGLVTAGLGLIVYALINGGGETVRWILSILGVAALAAFVFVESRVSAPMVPLSLFRSRTFTGTNLLTFLLYAALGGVLFFVPFNLIQVQHYEPAAAGASLLPFIACITAMSRWAGGLAAKIGARPLLTGGPLIAGVGFAMLAIPGIGGSFWTTFFPGITVLGIGMGFTVAPLTTAVMGSVDAHHAGVASGINNAVARAAGLLAVAALGVILLTRFNATLDREIAALDLPKPLVAAIADERPRMAAAELASPDEKAYRAQLRAAFNDAYVAGFRTLMLCGAGLAAAGALAGWMMVGSQKKTSGA